MNGIRTRGVIASALTVAGLLLATSSNASEERRYTTGYYSLELNGAPVGLLSSVDGGGVEADVINESSGVGSYVKKHVGAARITPLTLVAGAGMETAFYDWISRTWDQKFSAQSGAVVVADFNFQVQSRREFQNAYVTETRFPALDAASKEPATITLTVLPEMIRDSKGGGTISSSAATKGQRPWMASNFRLEIPGLNCSRVRRIEPITVKNKVVQDATGDTRGGSLVPGKTEFSDVVVTLPESDIDSWNDWMQSFLIQGKSDDTQEKNGDIVLLGSDLQSEVARIHLFNLGISSLSRDTSAGASALRTATARLYCERMAFEWKGNTSTVMNVREFGR